MNLIEVPYEYVEKWQRIGAREGVSLSPTGDTQWFRTEAHEGFAGMYWMKPDRVRIKGVFVHMEWRGQGIGTRMTEALIEIAMRRPGLRFIEAFAFNPSFYEARGFTRGAQRENGAVEVRKVFDGEGCNSP